MNEFVDRSVLDAGSIVLELRQHLSFSIRGSDEATSYYLVEDTLNSRFFRLGPTEYRFVSLLDGQRSIHAAYGQLSALSPNHALSETEALSLCQWLVDMDLAQTRQSSSSSRLVEKLDKVKRGKLLSNLNPLSFRLSFRIPPQFLAALVQWTGWMITWPAMFGLVVLTLIAAHRVVADWGRFASSTQAIFSTSNWIWLAACGMALKLVHEVAHGVVCYRFGGRVRRAGIMLLLFAPIPYVDVTSSWRFPSAGARIAVSVAGIVAEWWMAAIAAICWSWLEPGWLSHLCHNVVCMAGFTTVVFNANPLMKFDGYYVLADMCGITNLYTQGQRSVHATWRYWLLGVRSTMPHSSLEVVCLISVYGWLSWLWRISVAIALTIAATTFFGEASLVMAICAVCTWLILPSAFWLRSIFQDRSIQRPTRFLAVAKLGLAVVVLLMTLLFVPWPGAKRAPAVVEYSPLTLVRAGSDGFVHKIHVARDAEVAQGDLLFELDNKELVAELKNLEVEIRQSEIRERRHEQKGELAAKQGEAKNREALDVKRVEKERQVAALKVHAPGSGKLIHRDLFQLIGKYVKQGDELACIGGEGNKELRVSIAQDDYQAFADCVGRQVSLDVPGRWLDTCTLEKITPRADLTSVPTALTTINGGSIPVKQVKDGEAGVKQELIEPRLEAVAMLTATQSSQLHCGQRVSIIHRPLNDSMGAHLYAQLRRLLNSATSE